MFGYIKTKLQAWGQAPKAREQVTFDDEGVTRTRRDGLIEHVGWDELLSVDIATTNEGPWFDDVFWLLSAGDHGCVVPSEAEGMGELLTRLQELPGFDDEAVIRAMGCTDNELFPVWSRERSERTRAKSKPPEINGGKRSRPFMEGFVFALFIGGVTSGKYWGRLDWWKILLVFLIVCSLFGALNLVRTRVFRPSSDRRRGVP